MAILPLLNTGAEVQLRPGDIIGLVIVIAGFEFMSFVERKLPHVFTHGITPGPSSCAKTNVIVYFPVVNHRTFPLVFVAGISFVPGCILGCGFFADKMVNGEALQNCGSELGWL